MQPLQQWLELTDGTRLWTRQWMPDQTPRAIVCLVHGILEHSGRYEHVAQHLLSAGLGTAAFDLRGHGRSTGPRAMISDFNRLLDDVDAVLAQVAEQHEAVPLFLLGHSLGGLIATRFVMKLQSKVYEPIRSPTAALEGLILSGPFLRPGRGVSRLTRLATGMLGRWLPRCPIRVPFSPQVLSHDAEMVERYRQDPLIHHGTVPACTGWQLLAALEPLHDRFVMPTIPLLVLHGALDVLADPQASRWLVDRWGGQDRTLRLYDGLYHEVFNELPLRREEVLRDLTGWLLEHVPTRHQTAER